MKYIILILLLAAALHADYYFPPTDTDEWESIPIEQLNWDASAKDNLIDSLKSWNSKAFIVLKDGKIVIEEYMNGFQKDSIWYWASAGKSLTAFLVGLAQEQNYLDINDKTSTYLGTNWTSLDKEQEELITIRHQLTMTTGLDYSADLDCTDPECLKYFAPAGSSWYYHNAPYTLLHPVIEAATKQKINLFLYENISKKTGIEGAFFETGYNSLFLSKARSMARFGSLMLNNGTWNQHQIMQDTAYLQEMINTSQNLNKSYGYLWWLNGKSECMLPGSDHVFNTDIFQGLPLDSYAALGKNGQILLIVPSMNLVLVRMGESNDKALVSIGLVNDIWREMTKLFGQSSLKIEKENKPNVFLFDSQLVLDNLDHYSKIEVYNAIGQLLMKDKSGVTGSLELNFKDKIFFVRVVSKSNSFWFNFIRTD